MKYEYRTYSSLQYKKVQNYGTVVILPILKIFVLP